MPAYHFPCAVRATARALATTVGEMIVLCAAAAAGTAPRAADTTGTDGPTTVIVVGVTGTMTDTATLTAMAIATPTGTIAATGHVIECTWAQGSPLRVARNSRGTVLRRGCSVMP